MNLTKTLLIWGLIVSCQMNIASDQTILLGLKEIKNYKDTDLRDDKKLRTLPDNIQKYIFSFLFDVPYEYLPTTIRSYCMTYKYVNTPISNNIRGKESYEYLLERTVRNHDFSKTQILVAMGANPTYKPDPINAAPVQNALATAKYINTNNAEFKKNAYQTYKTLWHADISSNKTPLEPFPTDSTWMIRAQFGGAFDTK